MRKNRRKEQFRNTEKKHNKRKIKISKVKKYNQFFYFPLSVLLALPFFRPLSLFFSLPCLRLSFVLFRSLRSIVSTRRSKRSSQSEINYRCNNRKESVAGNLFTKGPKDSKVEANDHYGSHRKRRSYFTRIHTK